MIIGMAATRNWYMYMATVLYSLCKHNNIEKMYLFIEDDNIPFLFDERIEFINIYNLPEYVKKTSPNYNSFYTKMTFARCYFSKVLSCDKIIYIDVDALCVDNIQEIWDLNLENNVIVGVFESGEWEKYLQYDKLDNTYINAGFMLMDLKKIREEGIDDKILYLINNIKYAFPDQDTINIVCRDKIKHISNIYNSCETTGIVDNAKIIHYIREQKGWVKGSPRGEIWQKYFNEMIKGGKKMEENYKVKALISFDDYNGQEVREENKCEKREARKSEWWTTKERYEFLKSKNAVELVEIKKIELPKVHGVPVKIELKEEKKIKKEPKKRATRRIKK